MSVTFDSNPTSELEAVNMMLLSVGKAPVSTLTNTGINDVSWAQTTLYNVCRDVQHVPWWFNRETNYPITPNSSNQILIPANVLDIHPTNNTQPLNERNGMLYDSLNHTFDLTVGAWIQNGVLNCDIVWCFPYEQLPMAARMYIAMRAARQFQASAIGSQILYQFTKEMELEARAELMRSELKNSGTNAFTSPTRNGRIYNRQPYASPNNAWF